MSNDDRATEVAKARADDEYEAGLQGADMTAWTEIPPVSSLVLDLERLAEVPPIISEVIAELDIVCDGDDEEAMDILYGRVEKALKIFKARPAPAPSADPMDTYSNVKRDVRRVIRDLRDIADGLEEGLQAHENAISGGEVQGERHALAASLLRRYGRALHSIQNYAGGQGHTDPEHLVNLSFALAEERKRVAG